MEIAETWEELLSPRPACLWRDTNCLSLMSTGAENKMIRTFQMRRRPAWARVFTREGYFAVAVFIVLAATVLNAFWRA